MPCNTALLHFSHTESPELKKKKKKTHRAIKINEKTKIDTTKTDRLMRQYTKKCVHFLYLECFREKNLCWIILIKILARRLPAVSFVAKGQASSWGGRGPSPARTTESPQHASSTKCTCDTTSATLTATTSTTTATTAPRSPRLRSKQHQQPGNVAYHETSTRVGGGGECARDLSYIKKRKIYSLCRQENK